MESFFIREGNCLFPTPRSSIDIQSSVPPATYTVRVSVERGFYLQQVDNFALPERVYGSIDNISNRVMSTFLDRTVSTGVLFSGEKGSGKSLLSKLLSVKALKRGISTLIVSHPFAGEKFNTFIQSMPQEMVVLFDEFEKVYSQEQQEEMLTLLDGMYPTKKLFVLTCNDAWRIDKHMRNRPGRLYYSLAFRGMTPEDVAEYVAVELKNQEHAKGVLKFATLFRSFNFDMLVALVQEMNRYGETAAVAHKMLNAKPENEGTGSEYQMTLKVVDKDDRIVSRPGHKWHGVPFSEDPDPISITCLNPEWKQLDPELMKTAEGRAKAAAQDLVGKYMEVDISPEDMVPNESIGGNYVFKNAGGYKATFSPIPAVIRDYSAFLEF